MGISRLAVNVEFEFAEMDLQFSENRETCQLGRNRSNQLIVLDPSNNKVPRKVKGFLVDYINSDNTSSYGLLTILRDCVDSTTRLELSHSVDYNASTWYQSVIMMVAVCQTRVHENIRLMQCKINKFKVCSNNRKHQLTTN
jgi:hypothetical protein